MKLLFGWLSPRAKPPANDPIQDEFHSSDFRLLCLLPVGNQLAAYRLISKRRWARDYHLVLLPLQPSGSSSKTHKIIVRQIQHVGQPKYKTLTYECDLIGKDFEWGAPHAQAIEVVNLMALFIASLSADSILEGAWQLALEVCAAKVLGELHKL